MQRFASGVGDAALFVTWPVMAPVPVAAAGEARIARQPANPTASRGRLIRAVILVASAIIFSPLGAVVELASDVGGPSRVPPAGSPTFVAAINRKPGLRFAVGRSAVGRSAVGRSAGLSISRLGRAG